MALGKKKVNDGSVKIKKPFYKKWWFWVIVVIIVIGIFGGGKDDKTKSNSTEKTVESTVEQTESKSEEVATSETEKDAEDTKEKVATEAETDESKVETNSEEKTTEESNATKETDPKATIEQTIRNRIKDEYYDVDVDSITINDDLGTDEEGDYIALVNLTWNVKNSEKTSKEMISMYSDDLAGTLGQDETSVQELAIFWTIPYLNVSAKCSYERHDGAEGMYGQPGGHMWDNAVWDK